MRDQKREEEEGGPDEEVQDPLQSVMGI